MNGKITHDFVVFLLCMKGGSFFASQNQKERNIMNFISRILVKHKLKLLIFILLGSLIRFLNLYSLTFYQKILDAYQSHLLDVHMILLYGSLLIVAVILGYIDNYPSQSLYQGLYLDFKRTALKKVSTIDYLTYQSIGIGQLIQQVRRRCSCIT